MSDQQIVIPSDGLDPLGAVAEFIIGKTLTVFEACMIYTDQNPAVSASVLFRTGNHNEATIAGMDARLMLLGAAEEWQQKWLGAPQGTTRNPADLDPGPDNFLRDIAPHVLRGAAADSLIDFQCNNLLRQIRALPIYPSTDDPAWTSDEVYRALVAGIKAGKIKAKIAHLHDQPA